VAPSASTGPRTDRDGPRNRSNSDATIAIAATPRTSGSTTATPGSSPTVSLLVARNVEAITSPYATHRTPSRRVEWISSVRIARLTS
jgi:hypothetical protein